MNCEQVLSDGGPCENEAIGSYVWPGRQRRAACFKHLAWIARVAEAMGFQLDAGPKELRERELAERVIAALSPPTPTTGSDPCANCGHPHSGHKKGYCLGDPTTWAARSRSATYVPCPCGTWSPR